MFDKRKILAFAVATLLACACLPGCGASVQPPDLNPAQKAWVQKMLDKLGMDGNEHGEKGMLTAKQALAFAAVEVAPDGKLFDGMDMKYSLNLDSGVWKFNWSWHNPAPGPNASFTGFGSGVNVDALTGETTRQPEADFYDINTPNPAQTAVGSSATPTQTPGGA